jgi:hypothetical protein
MPEPMLAASLGVGLAHRRDALSALHPSAGGCHGTGRRARRRNGARHGLRLRRRPADAQRVDHPRHAAVAFNGLFPWRRYPAALVRPAETPAPMVVDTYAAISHEDFVYALTQLDSIIDVSEEDLLRIYALATGRHRDLEAQAAAERVSPSEPA